MNNILNITNTSEHPSRPGHTIFRFYNKERSDLFTELLNKESIWFEHDVDIEDEKTTYFFGIKNRDLKLTNRLNYLVNAKFRKPTIANKYLQWIIYFFALASIILIIIGYLSRH